MRRASTTLHSQPLRPQPNPVADAPAVELTVVEGRDATAPSLLHRDRQRAALHRVVRSYADVGPYAARVVLVGFARRRTRQITGQTGGGVRRADLGDAGLVQDRQGDRRRAGVELPDVGDRRAVGGRPAGVAARRLRCPTPATRGGVIERHVADAVAARLGSALGQREPGAPNDREGLRPAQALERQARIHGEPRLLSLTLHGGHERGGERPRQDKAERQLAHRRHAIGARGMREPTVTK